MTKSEVLRKFDAAVDVQQLRQNFPDIDFVITELEDGQQEIIVRVQGMDSGFKPSKDLQAIESMTVKDVTIFEKKNGTTLAKEKQKRKTERLQKRDTAFLKRVKQLAVEAGVSPYDLPRLTKSIVPKPEV